MDDVAHYFLFVIVKEGDVRDILSCVYIHMCTPESLCVSIIRIIKHVCS